LPVVQPAPLDEDLRRRDFTVNAMAVPLTPRGYGALIDPHGGLDDLRRRRIRVLHPLSFLEDPTRALRAVRLCTSRGLRMESDTARLLEVARRTHVFDRLSGSRLRREIEHLFSGPRPDEMLRAIIRSRLLAVTLPGIPTPAPGLAPALRRVPALVRRYGAAPGARSIRPWVVVVGMLLRRSAASEADALVARLQPSREAARALREVPVGLDRLLRRLARSGGAPRSSVYRICHNRTPEFLLMAASLTPRPELRRAVFRYLQRDAGAGPAISGRDLLAAGIAPGPAIAAGLEAALMAKLDGAARTAAQQLRVAVARARRA
jgi:tRNA nucleotidyltransferase (CCA-adding enzyme)